MLLYIFLDYFLHRLFLTWVSYKNAKREAKFQPPGRRPRNKNQKNSNSISNRRSTLLPINCDSNDESINVPSDYSSSRGSSEYFQIPAITMQSPASTPTVIDYVPNHQQRKINRRRVISNQEIRESLKPKGLCTQLTDFQPSTILVPEEGHEDDIEIGEQQPMPPAVPGHLNPVLLTDANASPLQGITDWRSFKLQNDG